VARLALRSRLSAMTTITLLATLIGDGLTAFQNDGVITF
jgi:hypothetical protein